MKLNLKELKDRIRGGHDLDGGYTEDDGLSGESTKSKVTNIPYTEYVNSNVKCAKVIDVIFDLINDLMDKDRSVSGFHKAIVKSTSSNFKNPVKDYVMKMKKEDADVIIRKVSDIIIDNK